uniref:Uncharacterized protein n=1 Tax=Rhizophagus irregularis (strain DAOM 181602 / DAOM 197198 / MUCL 43194) TaxID=747089 RepID=U9T9T9_RHIID
MLSNPDLASIANYDYYYLIHPENQPSLFTILSASRLQNMPSNDGISVKNH